jgi:hypothetical protein
MSQQQSTASKNTQPQRPLTFVEVMRSKNWGAGEQSLRPEPGKDHYYVTAGGKAADENWEPTADDFARLAELFRS